MRVIPLGGRKLVIGFVALALFLTALGAGVGARSIAAAPVRQTPSPLGHVEAAQSVAAGSRDSAGHISYLPGYTGPRYEPATQPAKATGGVSPFINRVPCDGRTEWYILYNDTGTVCWANSGTARVDIYRVYQVCTGNNTGYMLYTIAPDGVTVYYSPQPDKYTCYVGYNPPIYDVFEIDIS